MEKKTLSLQAVVALEKTTALLIVGNYSEKTICQYVGELRYLFSHYCDIAPVNFDSEMVLQYLLYLTKTLNCSRVKCKMAAQSISFFFKNVLEKAYVIPTIIYPRKSYKLPAVMDADEILKVINTIKNVKHRTLVMLLYSTGVRLDEIAHLRITDIDSKNMCIKVVQGKGKKDRFTLLSQQVLLELRAYYIQYRPVEYLFNGAKKGSPYSLRSIQMIVQKALIKAGLENNDYSVHTFRHSFATHLVDNGTDLHTVKELLGHSNLTTTMQYLHLSHKRMESIVNPFDLLAFDNLKPANNAPGSLLHKIQ